MTNLRKKALFPSMTCLVCISLVTLCLSHCRLGDRDGLEKDRSLPWYDMSKPVHQFINNGLVINNDFTPDEMGQLKIFKYIQISTCLFVFLIITYAVLFLFYHVFDIYVLLFVVIYGVKKKKSTNIVHCQH